MNLDLVNSMLTNPALILKSITRLHHSACLSRSAGARAIARFALAAGLAALLFTSLSCAPQAQPGELTMLIEKRIPTFDPRVSSDSAAERLRQLLFNGLTRMNEEFEPVPDAAESFEAAPDYQTFTFKLRGGIKFHDGRELSSRDVKYTFETLMASGFPSQKAGDFTRQDETGAPPVAFIEAADPRTVIFRCNRPFPGLPNAVIPVGIIPEGSGEQQAKSPIGTGPFKFVSYTEDQEVVLAAHDNYFEGRPQVNLLRVRIVPDNSTRESELRKGSVDLAINADFEPVTVESLQTAEGLQVVTADGTNLAHLGLNLLDPILKDQRVRQALAYGIDRETLIRDILRGQARPANSLLPPRQRAFEPNVTTYHYDPERAKQLLDAAGRKAAAGQSRFKLTLKTSTISISRKIAEVMQEQVRRIGIELEVQSLEAQKLTQDLTDGNFQLYFRTFVGGNQSTDMFRFVYHSRSVPPNGQNRSRYSNPEVDRLLDEALTATRERQREIFARVQQLLAEELPQIYLWYPATIAVHRSRVSGLALNPTGDWSVVRHVKVN
jgi:peptide/nickel transport system substrate-binding protein